MKTNVILPAQKSSSETLGLADRGLELKSTRQALIEGERSCKVKYSAYRPKKGNRTISDNFARFLWYTKHENARSNQGIFDGKALSEDELDKRVWLLLSRIQFEMIPSRAKSSKVGVIFDVPQSSTSEASLGHGSDNDTEMEDEPKTDPADVRLDGAACVRAERTSDTMDPKDPYWQRTMIKRGFERGRRLVGGQDWASLFPRGRETHKYALCSMGGRGRWHTRSTSIVVHHSFTEESAEAFDRQERIFNNLSYQRENHAEACVNLNITGTSVPRSKDKPHSTKLESRQLVTLNSIREFKTS